MAIFPDDPQTSGPLCIAMIGTRGVPAHYGGFETAIEEIGQRLVARGHRVVVYSRGSEPSSEHLGMERKRLASVQRKQLETLSHTALSSMHSALRLNPDVAFVFNAANSPFLPFFRSARIPVALHMDGLEWKRAKWNAGGQRYYRWSEAFGVRWADALIADAPGIADYYRDEFGVPTELIRYGAPILKGLPEDGVRDLGLTPGGYHLVVARFEPENHVLDIVDGYRRSEAQHPLVVVGSAPYAASYTRSIEEMAASDDRIRLLGGVWDQPLLDALYHHALTYVHGHSVGGTNPSLLRAIGAGTPVIAYDVNFNREIIGDHGLYFSSAEDVTASVENAERDPARALEAALELADQARREFDWDDVADEYGLLAARLAGGHSIHEVARSARRRSSRQRG
jgi:glycosyltransferase involved in cell wall biosynthesis